MPWDPVVLREALLREHYRGGQSFFVTPRVADLPDIEEFFREHVPELTYVVAHGQMAAGDVEDRMSAFYDRKYDVLISTTIVESGLDIPSANTMIIHRADRFGLAQLYQLRGRVGRALIVALNKWDVAEDPSALYNGVRAALDDGLERGRQHLLVGGLGINRVGACEGNAVAANDGHATDGVHVRVFL